MRELAAAILFALILAADAHAYPGWWKKQAACIRHHESTDRWHIRNPPYGGAYQFVDSTWEAFRPRSFPVRSWRASPAQQTLVAWRVYVANGRRWGGNQWPVTSRICGVR